ncbi:MAG: hypothetical protein ACYCYR_14520 [Desulfobulbaceae bacterium]|jgi:hypothetical protein
MKLKVFILIVTITIIPTFASAQTIELKGLKIGMHRAEVEKKYPTWADFTIAGVKTDSDHGPMVEYYEDKLDCFIFSFDSDNFNSVKEAVNHKYPDISCENSIVNNAMGANFEQISCELKYNESSLYLTRFGNDVTSSLLALTSQRWLDEKDKNKEVIKNDI